MWELDCEEGWAPKNWCFWAMVLEKTLESPLDSKMIKLVHPKGNQFWIFIGRTDDESEAPILLSLMGRTDSLEKTLILERLKAGERNDRGWNDWMASRTQWTWVWASSGSSCAAVLEVPKNQTGLSDWTELNWTDTIPSLGLCINSKVDESYKYNLEWKKPDATLYIWYDPTSVKLNNQQN